MSALNVVSCCLLVLVCVAFDERCIYPVCAHTLEKIQFLCCVGVVFDPGPMVYGICYCPLSRKDDMKALKVAGKPTIIHGGCGFKSGFQDKHKSVFCLIRFKDSNRSRERKPLPKTG